MGTDLKEGVTACEVVNSADLVLSNIDVSTHLLIEGVNEAVILIKSDEGDVASEANRSDSMYPNSVVNTNENSSDGRIHNQDTNSVNQDHLVEGARDSVDPRVSGAVVVLNFQVEDLAGIRGKHHDLVLSKEKVNGVVGQCDGQEMDGMMASTYSIIPGSSSNSNSCNPIKKLVSEKEMLVKSLEDNASCSSTENRDVIPCKSKEHEVEFRNDLADTLMVKDLKVEKNSCVINVNFGITHGKVEDNLGERICRICHLGCEKAAENAVNHSTYANGEMGMIHLGCGCKEELGIAHLGCAEAWFKLKGNRLCEICGEVVQNVTGVWDSRFMERWNTGPGFSGHLSEGDGGCWRRQPFCNFLMACLVIAFVLSWFLRVNMF